MRSHPSDKNPRSPPGGQQCFLISGGQCQYEYRLLVIRPQVKDQYLS